MVSRLELLDRYWDNFQENHVVLLQSEIPRDHRYFAGRQYSKAESAYVAALGVLYDARAKLHPRPEPLTPDAPIPEQPRSSARLPRITVPVFSGCRNDWE